jgi:hypothetical protein
MTIDVHQHLWPAPFLAALRARPVAPRLDGWTLHLPGEPPFAVDPAHHDVGARVALAEEDGLALAAVAPSAALGLERLPRDEFAELAAAWQDGAADLPVPFRWWATAQTPEQLRAALDGGALGLELGAAALAAPGGLDRVAPLLDVLDAAGAPVLIHPGPAGSAAYGGSSGLASERAEDAAMAYRPEGGDDDLPAAAHRPAWWAAAVPYVAELHAAWWAWADGGRARFPHLPVCFVALAGLGPLHGERVRARGGARGGTVDPFTYVETSSYGTQGVDAVIRVLGIDVVCHGTDRPYSGPVPLGFGDAAEHAIRTANPTRLLAGVANGIPA